MSGATTVGILYPGHAAEDDYPLLERLLAPSVALRVVHTSVGEDAHRVDALRDLGGADRLAAGARQLRSPAVDAVVWACTSGSFVFGWEGAQDQASAVARALGVPASSTSLAFVQAARALRLVRVAVAATYPADVTDHFARFLRRGGIEVVGLSSAGIVTAAEVGQLDRDEVLQLAAANDHPDADGVLLPDTALHTVAWVEELEERLGKPVLSANQVSVWEGLRIAGHGQSHAGPGTLFRHRVPDASPTGDRLGRRSGEISRR